MSPSTTPEWVQHARRPIDRTAREHFVYWVIDADGCVIYIGCTRAPGSRQSVRESKKVPA